jgi:hypothetical protein
MDGDDSRASVVGSVVGSVVDVPLSFKTECVEPGCWDLVLCKHYSFRSLPPSTPPTPRAKLHS